MPAKKVGYWVCLTPLRKQFVERDATGGFPKAGNINLRRTLCQAETVMIHRVRAKVAPARRIRVILCRLCVDGTASNSNRTRCVLTSKDPTITCLTAGLRCPHNDAVPMLIWSRRLLRETEHACRMDTLELH